MSRRDLASRHNSEEAFLFLSSPRIERIREKLDHIQRQKPKWYKSDEEKLEKFDRNLDDQIRHINRQREPAGIEAAERGH